MNKTKRWKGVWRFTQKLTWQKQRGLNESVVARRKEIESVSYELWLRVCILVQLHLHLFQRLPTYQATTNKVPITSKLQNFPEKISLSLPNQAFFSLSFLSITHFLLPLPSQHLKKGALKNIVKTATTTTKKKQQPTSNLLVLERDNENDQIRERWKHALSAIKASTPQKGSFFTLITHSYFLFTTHNPTTQLAHRKRTTTVTNIVSSFLNVLRASEKIKGSLDFFSAKKSWLFLFQIEDPHFSCQKARWAYTIFG